MSGDHPRDGESYWQLLQVLVKENPRPLSAAASAPSLLAASAGVETRRGLLTALSFGSWRRSPAPIPSCDSCLSEGTRPEKFSEWTLLSPLEEKFRLQNNPHGVPGWCHSPGSL